jgi:hypothetical protein
MRAMPWCVLIVHLAATAAPAQTLKDLQIRLGAYTSNKDGGERPVGVWFSTGPIVIGKRVTSTFSVGEDCEAFTVSSNGSLRKNASAAWSIELMPTRVVRDAVTFRVRWQMAGMSELGDRYAPELAGRYSRELGTVVSPYDELELTLRPGESFPVYTLRNISGYSCAGVGSIKASVDGYPDEEDEHRLVATDLWLVERISNGGEVQRSQPLSIRGLPNRPFDFYFDGIVEGSALLEIYGTLIPRLENDAIDVALETRCRWPSGSPNIVGPQRYVKSEAKLKPGETVEIRLPILSDDAGAFAKRAFSIRIRARQLR